MDISFFKQNELAEAQKFIKEHWNTNHVYVRNNDVVNHLFLNTPYRERNAGCGNYSILGGWEGSKVAGLLGVIPQEFNVAGRLFESFTASIWKIDKDNFPKANGLELYDYVLTKFQNFNACVLLGLSDIAYRIYADVYGWKKIDCFSRWIGINNFDKVAEVLLPKGTQEWLMPAIEAKEFEHSFKVLIDELDESKWNDFYENRFAPITIGTRRDYQFLQWRYLQSPVLRYHTIALEKEGKYYGLAVIRIEPIFDGKYFIGRILEFMAVDAEASVLLADEVIKFDKDVLMWDFYCLSGVTAFGLEAVGLRCIPAWMDKVMMPTRFQPVDYEHLNINGAVYISDKIERIVRRLPSSVSWYITKGDSDQDRAN